ncbi:MAG: DNA repair protein RecO [Planctomycetota bacterium]
MGQRDRNRAQAMAILKSDALVLRRTEFSDTSQVVAFLTPEHGRLSCLARGSRAVWLTPHRSRRIDSPFDTLTLNRICWYPKRGDALHLVSECEVIHSFAEVRRDLAHWHAAVAIQELTLAASQPDHPEQPLYYAAARGLVELCSEADWRLVIVDFLARYLAAIGRAPDTSGCAVSGRRLGEFDEVVFSVRGGRGYGAPHAPPLMPGGRVVMPGVAVEVLRRLLGGVRKPLTQVSLPDVILQPLAALLQGMVVEVLDRSPISFRYLPLGAALRPEPVDVR